MTKTILILLLSVSLFPFNLHAQSGRKKPEPKPAKDQPTKPADANEEINDSDKTGGRFYSGDSLFGIAQAFTWIAEELGRQYSIGYYPSKTGQNGERRQIKVKVTEVDLVVKARESYIYSDKKTTATQYISTR